MKTSREPRARVRSRPARRSVGARRVALASLCAALAGPVAADAAATPASPGAVRVLGEVALDLPGAVSVSGLEPGAALDAAAHDPAITGRSTLAFIDRSVARETLADLLAWRPGRGVADGAHARPALAASGGTPGDAPGLRPWHQSWDAPWGDSEGAPAGERFASFGQASGEGAPRLGAALPVGAGDAVGGRRAGALDLSLGDLPLSSARPGDVVVDDVPGLSFERRTRYRVSAGRPFLDLRLRHRDPLDGEAALEDEARTAAAIVRMRPPATLTLEPTSAPPRAVDVD